MTTSDYALIISLCAVSVSVFSLAWNVWQKFLFVKPALQVSFGLNNVWLPGAENFAKTGQTLGILRATAGAKAGLPKQPDPKKAPERK